MKVRPFTAIRIMCLSIAFIQISGCSNSQFLWKGQKLMKPVWIINEHLVATRLDSLDARSMHFSGQGGPSEIHLDSIMHLRRVPRALEGRYILYGTLSGMVVGAVAASSVGSKPDAFIDLSELERTGYILGFTGLGFVSGAMMEHVATMPQRYNLFRRSREQKRAILSTLIAENL